MVFSNFLLDLAWLGAASWPGLACLTSLAGLAGLAGLAWLALASLAGLPWLAGWPGGPIVVSGLSGKYPGTIRELSGI